MRELGVTTFLSDLCGREVVKSPTFAAPVFLSDLCSREELS
ncbi:hypothetical protein AO381_0574 [Moraxella catarrhalis]|nr:hypothetical protein AO381_0574 [Moraxella catarrhalis]